MKFFKNLYNGLTKVKVGMTGFEPATPRTPCVCATELRHIPFLKYDDRF